MTAMTAILNFGILLLFSTPLLGHAKLYPAIRACLTLSNVQCPCGTSGQIVSAFVEDCMMVDAEHSARCEPCDPRILPTLDPCRNFTMCATCDPMTRSCSSCPRGMSGRYCDMPREMKSASGRYAKDMEHPNSGDMHYLGYYYNRPAAPARLYGDDPYDGMPSGGHYGRPQGYMAGQEAPMDPYNDRSADYPDMGPKNGYGDYSDAIPKEEPYYGGGGGYPDYLSGVVKRDLTDDFDSEPEGEMEGSENIIPPVSIFRQDRHFAERSKRSVDFSGYPIEVVIPAGQSTNLNRHARSASECFFPDHMDTAEIRCTIWPTYTKCNVTCIWGHTLTAGRSVMIKCRNRENAWKPYGFKECDPYVDCSLKLKSPGSVNCVYNRLNDPIDCDIMCNEYDDIPEVPKKTYACTLAGDFKPPLPFCVEKANTTVTVPPPAFR